MRRRRRNISVYIDSTGSGGRGWVTHLLHLLVEEGAKVENFSRYNPIISQGGGGINLNKYDSTNRNTKIPVEMMGLTTSYYQPFSRYEICPFLSLFAPLWAQKMG